MAAMQDFENVATAVSDVQYSLTSLRGLFFWGRSATAVAVARYLRFRLRKSFPQILAASIVIILESGAPITTQKWWQLQ